MKVLVLHNNNLPFFLRDPMCTTMGDHDFEARVIKYDSSIHRQSFDSFVSSELSFLKESEYDIILLPFTFSEENYLEYTGIRVAAHIRLTPSWGKLTVPLLFVGPDTVDDITKLSDLGEIINSYHVFTTDKSESCELFEVIDNIVNKYPCKDVDKYIESKHYQKLVRSLNIEPPANYATHHSIANEWAIMRWTQMFDWEGQEPEIEDKSILDMLYFKLLLANKVGPIEAFNRKWKKNHSIAPVIKGIEDKKILYIDDEAEKGWESLLGTIIKNSNAQLLTYPFVKGLSQEDLLLTVKKFIDENEADCYLVDLRLHDKDFDPDVDSKDFTGIQVAKYIKSLNLGNQIVMFTASNKTWNYEEAVANVGVNAYIIKESPEYNYSRVDTQQNFNKLSKVIKDAVNHAYIAKYVDIVRECSYMNKRHQNILWSFVEMLSLNEAKTIKTNILNLALFIESYIVDNFRVDGPHVRSNNKDESFEFTPARIHFNKDFSNVHFYAAPKPKYADEYILDPDKKLSIIILVLHYHYGFSEEICNLYMRLRSERNGTVAHHGGETSLSMQDLKDVFEKIIIKIIEKDKGKKLDLL